MKLHRYKELDALRGIAALLVVFFHYTMGREESKLGFKLGATGVDLFFIISGFVIYMSLLNVKSSYEFAVNRVSRLYPTYWTVVTFTSLLLLITSSKINFNFIDYLGNMTMFQYYLGIKNLDGPYWTMIIEMIFYIGIAILFQFNMLKYINLIGLLLSGSAVFITVFRRTLTLNAFKVIPFLSYVPLFIAGIIFFDIYTTKTNLIPKYACLLFCLICQILLFNFAGPAHLFISHIEYVIMLMIYFTLFTLFVNGKLKFIVSKTTLFFGKISFCLYLIHQQISIGFIIPILTTQYHVNFWIASFIIALPIVVILASVITFYIEIPFRNQMRRHLLLLTAYDSKLFLKKMFLFLKGTRP